MPKCSSVPLWLPSRRSPVVSDYVKERLSEQEGTLANQVLQKEKRSNDGQLSNCLRACRKRYIHSSVLHHEMQRRDTRVASFLLSTACMKPSLHSLKTEVSFCLSPSVSFCFCISQCQFRARHVVGSPPKRSSLPNLHFYRRLFGDLLSHGGYSRADPPDPCCLPLLGGGGGGTSVNNLPSLCSSPQGEMTHKQEAPLAPPSPMAGWKP